MKERVTFKKKKKKKAKHTLKKYFNANTAIFNVCLTNHL